MCKAVEELQERTRQETFLELLREGCITMEVACAKLNKTEEEVQKLLSPLFRSEDKEKTKRRN